MKILYAIQGTGNGHLSRAMDVIPCLQKKGEVDVLISGIQADLGLPFPVKYKYRGLSFIFGKSGGVDLWKTFIKCSSRKLVKEINELDVSKYDLILNDFEPVSAWACYLKNIPCIGLSHQSAVLSDKIPKLSESDMIGKFILKNYAPNTAHYGFHFQAFDDNIFTPVIRQQIRETPISNQGHYTVYLPAYDDKRLISRLSQFKNIEWDIFSKHNKIKVKLKDITIQPINNQDFISSMASSAGVLCGAGFETPAEALFMGKKLLVIPMKNQFEQQLNASALASMRIPVLKSLKPKHDHIIEDWLGNGEAIRVDYPEQTQKIVDLIIEKHSINKTKLI